MTNTLFKLLALDVEHCYIGSRAYMNSGPASDMELIFEVRLKGAT